jgi:hypothetical protein
MDYYQGVVGDFLRADRSVFINTEYCIQLNEADNPDTSGPHWYCDALAVNFRDETVYLCEISYAKSLGALAKRLEAWNLHWPQVKGSIIRDSTLPEHWAARPWLFIPEECVGIVVKAIERLAAAPGGARSMPEPRITTLESVAPWKYRSWNRKGEAQKPDCIPDSMK